jgi:hypothetical protein
VRTTLATGLLRFACAWRIEHHARPIVYCMALVHGEVVRQNGFPICLLYVLML